MRRRLIALTTAVATATALSLAPVAGANGQEVSASAGTAQSAAADGGSTVPSSSQDGKEFDLATSSYINALKEGANAPDDEAATVFGALGLDFLIGLAAFIVLGSLYGEIAKRMPNSSFFPF